MELEEKIQTSQFIMFAFLSMAGVLGTVLSFQLNGVNPTINFITTYSVPLSFLFLLAVSFIPIYNKTSSRMRKIAGQFGFTFILITLGSFTVWTHSHFITISNMPPAIQLIYSLAGRLWYITGIGVVASGVLGVNYIDDG